MITDAVPMGVSVKEAADHIKLIVQLNDWSLRVIGPVEMKTGFGWVRAKPACSVAPFAVTSEEIGLAWRNSRVCLELRVDWNGQRFGAANGSAMEFGFGSCRRRAVDRALSGSIRRSGRSRHGRYWPRSWPTRVRRRPLRVRPDRQRQ